jgi:excisionase family DNA binding protein
VAQDGARSRFLTVAEVAGELRVSTMTVYRLIKSEQLPATRVGKSLRIRTDDVERFLEGRYTEAG